MSNSILFPPSNRLIKCQISILFLLQTGPKGNLGEKGYKGDTGLRGRGYTGKWFCIELYFCITAESPLKAYSLMSNRGRSQNFQDLNFLHIFIALFYEAHFLKGIRLKSFQYEMRAVFTGSLVHETLFNTWVYGSNETHIIMHNFRNVSSCIRAGRKHRGKI